MPSAWQPSVLPPQRLHKVRSSVAFGIRDALMRGVNQRNQPPLPFTPDGISSASEEPAKRRPPGRPRKWASDAERSRAYRDRRRLELADPQRLREERRDLQGQVAELTVELNRERRRAQRLSARVEMLERELEAERARSASIAIATRYGAQVSSGAAVVMNRSQRREAARRAAKG